MFFKIRLTVDLAYALGYHGHAAQKVGVTVAHALQFRGYIEIEFHLLCSAYLRYRGVDTALAKIVRREFAARLCLVRGLYVLCFHTLELGNGLIDLRHGTPDLAVALRAFFNIAHYILR